MIPTIETPTDCHGPAMLCNAHVYTVGAQITSLTTSYYNTLFIYRMPDSLEDEGPPGLSTPENIAAVQQLIRPRFTHDIHDYVLEGICKAMDGFHIVSIVKTGGGKTTYFSGYMVLLQELTKLPASHPLKFSINRPIPDNPLCIVVFPTKGLEEDMVCHLNYHYIYMLKHSLGCHIQFYWYSFSRNQRGYTEKCSKLSPGFVGVGSSYRSPLSPSFSGTAVI